MCDTHVLQIYAMSIAPFVCAWTLVENAVAQQLMFDAWSASFEASLEVRAVCCNKNGMCLMICTKEQSSSVCAMVAGSGVLLICFSEGVTRQHCLERGPMWMLRGYAAQELGMWMQSKLDAHSLFERLSEEELAADTAAGLLTEASEEAQKVARNAGQVCPMASQ